MAPFLLIRLDIALLIIRRKKMKTFLIVALTALCVLTSSIAFANIISLGQATPEPIIMLVLGIGLLGIAGVTRRHI